MKIHKLPETKDINNEQEENARLFFKELIDLCNKYRITISIKRIMFLHKNVIDGKLLDVAGFTYNKEGDCTNPVFVDRMSK